MKPAVVTQTAGGADERESIGPIVELRRDNAGARLGSQLPAEEAQTRRPVRIVRAPGFATESVPKAQEPALPTAARTTEPSVSKPRHRRRPARRSKRISRFRAAPRPAADDRRCRRKEWTPAGGFRSHRNIGRSSQLSREEANPRAAVSFSNKVDQTSSSSAPNACRSLAFSGNSSAADHRRRR